MCGIAGLFRAAGVGPADREAVIRMTAAQAHRGPDDDGIFQDAAVVLGHRRLSIIDTSRLGHQPMSNRAGTIWMVFGGEVYNHVDLRHELEGMGCRFTSASDSEVLLQGYEEWGMERLLPRLRGMFAFAIYDLRDAPRLLLARDRLGIKPLYFHMGPSDTVLFASEVGAVAASGMVGREADPNAMIGLLALGSVPGPHTLLEEVRSLPPGHYLESSAHGASTRRYWSIDDFPPSKLVVPAPDLSLVLEEAIRRHLLADVPLGVFLSGGLDSIATVAVASRVSGTRLKTLTVTFPEIGGGEEALAREAANWFDTDHRVVEMTSAGFLDAVPRFLAAMDQPTHDGLNTFVISEAAAQAGLTVVLSGLGGDEVFWGYRHYRLAAQNRAIAILRALPAAARRTALFPFGRYGRASGQERWARAEYLGLLPWDQGLYMFLRGFFGPRQVAELLGADLAAVVRVVSELLPVPAELEADSASTLNRTEFKRYLHDQLLRDSDVFSMASSIELRVPLLDDDLVEAVLPLGPTQKLNAELNKPLLVAAAKDPRMATVAARPKQGFVLPMDRWLRDHGKDLSEQAASGGVLDPAVVRAMWSAFDSRRLHWSRAWALVAAGASRRAS